MKYIPKLSTLTTLLSIILGFAACDNEQECALYNTDAANRAVFVNASLANITVSPADPTFTSSTCKCRQRIKWDHCIDCYGR